jgi:hypothetical protein
LIPGDHETQTPEMRDNLQLLLLLTLLTLEGKSTASTAHVRDKELSVTLWRVFPDTAVFDWYITLAEKHQMVSCNLTYGPQADRNKTRLVTEFLPQHRSFSLLNLEQNTSHWFLMVCRDREDLLRSSKNILFDTGVSIAVSDPRLGAIFSPRRQVIESANLDIRSKYIMGSYKQRDPVSPHTIMGGLTTLSVSVSYSGVSCGVVGLVIVGLTAGLVVRRHSAAPTIKMPKEGEEDAVLDTQVFSSEEMLGYITRTGSVSSAASYIDLESYTDTATYSYTEGEPDLPCTDTGLHVAS